MKLPDSSICAVIGTAKDIGKNVEKSVKNLLSALSCFKEVHFFVIESFSNDDTIEKLTLLSKLYPNFNFISITESDRLLKQRTDRLASARNYGKIWVQKCGINFDYVVVADLDEVNNGINSHAVLSCWNFSDWDAMFANQKYYYYDLWALRHEFWCPNDCWIETKNLIPIFGAKKAHDFSIYRRMVYLKGEKPIKVKSAFGGLGIYKCEVYFHSQYAGSDSQGTICEHVPFNERLTENGFSLFINPKLINQRGIKRLFIWKFRAYMEKLQDLI